MCMNWHFFNLYYPLFRRNLHHSLQRPTALWRAIHWWPTENGKPKLCTRGSGGQWHTYCAPFLLCAGRYTLSSTPRALLLDSLATIPTPCTAYCSVILPRSWISRHEHLRRQVPLLLTLDEPRLGWNDGPPVCTYGPTSPRRARNPLVAEWSVQIPLSSVPSPPPRCAVCLEWHTTASQRPARPARDHSFRVPRPCGVSWPSLGNCIYLWWEMDHLPRNVRETDRRRGDVDRLHPTPTPTPYCLFLNTPPPEPLLGLKMRSIKWSRSPSCPPRAHAEPFRSHLSEQLVRYSHFGTVISRGLVRTLSLIANSHVQYAYLNHFLALTATLIPSHLS